MGAKKRPYIGVLIGTGRFDSMGGPVSRVKDCEAQIGGIMGPLAELFEVQDLELFTDASYKEVIEKGMAPLTDDEKKEIIKLVESSRGLAYHKDIWARLAVIETKLKRVWMY